MFSLLMFMTPKYRAMLINLKDYEYVDPGYDYPGWKMGVLNRLKNEQMLSEDMEDHSSFPISGLEYHDGKARLIHSIPF